jgi:tRNA-dihydrouridine synthase
MAEASGADAIDINMGCPSKKVTDTGAGADLMRFPAKAESILRECRKRIRCPLTIKIRSGWDADRINALEISKLAEDCGVDAVTVHPRTRKHGFMAGLTENHWLVKRLSTFRHREWRRDYTHHEEDV